MSGMLNTSGNWAQTALFFGLDMTVKATALFALAWLAHWALGRRRALARSAVWNACMLGLLCLPLADLAFPSLHLRIISVSRTPSPPPMISPIHSDVPVGLSADGIVAELPDGTIAERAPTVDRPESAALESRSQHAQSRDVTVTTTHQPTSASADGTTEAPAESWSVTSMAEVLISIFCGVGGLLALRLVGSLAAVAKLRCRCSAVESPVWAEGRDRWAARLGLKRSVALLRSNQVSIPAVVGHFRAAIIIPTSLADAPSERLVDAVVLHELAHIRRSDFGWNVLRKFAQALYWPHPLAWLLGRVIAQVREQVCDDLCVHEMGGAAAYRGALVKIASSLVHRPAPALGMAMAREMNLSRRLRWIDQSGGASSCLLALPARISLVMAVVALAAVLGAVELSRSTIEAAEPPELRRVELDDQKNNQQDARLEAKQVVALEEIIKALRTEEEKYRDIEYSLRLTTRKLDPKVPKAPSDAQSRETRRVVLQDDRVWFRSDSTSRVFDTDRQKQEYSAYDGEQTRSVIVGNSVNIHLGRFEHPDVYPAHTVSLIHCHLNFPLSVYLSGSDAIHAHPKYGRFMRESGSVNEFTKVEAHVDGEEQVDGLRCIKIRVNRWYYSTDAPSLQYLWLAPERNYLCIKEQWTPSWLMAGGLPMHEMRAEDLREIAPGVWFPLKITVSDYGTEALQQKKLLVERQTETVVEKVDLNPRHDAAFFRDVEIPAGSPVFTIRDGKLVGSSMPEPIADEATEKAKLEEVVAKVQEQELLYADLEVKARVKYKHLGLGIHTEGVITEQMNAGRSVLRGNLAYFTEHVAYSTAGGMRSAQNEVQAFDGKWTRVINRFARDDQREQRSASLRKGGGGKAEGRHDGVPVFRPHTFLLRDDWLYGPLADLLVSPWHDKVNEYRLRFRYCGEEDFEGHPCVKLRGDITTSDGQPPHSFMALWLATDRNYIPIKLEHYGGNFGLQPIPGGIKRCDDFRQIAPGVWYPFRSTLLAFDNWQHMAQRRITLNWRRVYEVESVTLSPKVDAAMFHDVVVSAATKVQVSDEEGNHLGEYDHEAEGVAEITPARYLSLLSEAKVRDEEQKARQLAIDALVGKPAPEFPAGAAWLNGEPLTWASLRGKVVILSFWAEWCGPCRNDFPQLSLLHGAREANGLTIVGVHPPGSATEDIKKVTDEFRLGYPICIDVPPHDGAQAWGDLFGQFAVHAIPHAVAVDGGGTIVACGQLQEVVEKANRVKKR